MVSSSPTPSMPVAEPPTRSRRRGAGGGSVGRARAAMKPRIDRRLLVAEPGAGGEVAALVAASGAEQRPHAVLAEPVELVDRPHDDAASAGMGLRVGRVEDAGDLHGAVQHLAIVDADQIVAARDPRRLQRLGEHGADLGVRRDRGGADGVGVALVELPEAPRPRLLVAPDRTDLIAAVGVRQAHPVLGEDPRERRGQVVAQRQPGLVLVLPGEDALVRAVDVGEELAQRLDGLDRAGLQRLEAPGVVDLA